MVVDEHEYMSVPSGRGPEWAEDVFCQDSKGVPIGRLSQRHDLDNCLLAMQKLHRVRNA